MKTALPGGVTIAKPPGANPVRVVMIAVVAVIVIFLVRSVFMHHESTYERIARELTTALQQNDIAGVDKLQNSETRTHVTRAAVGRDADLFAPLGKLDRVRQTAVDGETHEFDAVFANGTVHETIQFDPDNKIVHFRPDQPTKK
jgi:hypothetical protein